MQKGERPFALVTGGNRGLGLETARQLVARDFRVVLTSRDPAQGRRAVESLGAVSAESAGGAAGEAIFWPLDVADRESIRALGAHARAEWPPFDALVNNAGVSLGGFDATVARRTIDVNFYGAMRVTDELLPRLASPSNVVMVSSGMGELAGMPADLRPAFADPALTREALIDLVERFVGAVGKPAFRREGWPSNAYRVSKVALNALTRILAQELNARGIRVNAVCPGWVRTDMGGRAAPRSVERGADVIVWAATLGKDGPTGGFFRDRRAIDW